MCTNCWDTDHARNKCKNNPKCKVCLEQDHSPGDPKCKFYEPQQHVIAFNGEDNVLSNFFPCEINLYGVCHKSAEHAFQYAKAMQCGDLDAAKTILTAEDALSAKRLSDKVRINDQWSTTCEAVMTEVIENKCVQVQQSREKLRSVKRNVVLAESTYNDTWGTGLNKTGTENTKQQAWPGKNPLGHILSKIAKRYESAKRVINGAVHNRSRVQNRAASSAT